MQVWMTGATSHWDFSTICTNGVAENTVEIARSPLRLSDRLDSAHLLGWIREAEQFHQSVLFLLGRRSPYGVGIEPRSEELVSDLESRNADSAPGDPGRASFQQL